MRKIHRVLLIIFGVLLIVLTVAAHKVDILLETVVKQELDKIIERSDSSFYHIE